MLDLKDIGSHEDTRILPTTEKTSESPLDMKISEKEVQALSKLEPFKRYQYFIKRVADAETLYTLLDKDGDFALSDVEDKVMFSVWPAAEFAAQCAFDEWDGFTVQEVSLEEFENQLIDQIEENHWLLNVFAINRNTGFVVDINEFARDLSDELKKYH